MTDETLIADLVRAGMTDPELLQRVANLMSRNVPGMSGTSIQDYERDRKRRQRANAKEIKGNSEANDAELPIANVPELSRTVPENRCDLTSFLSSSDSLPTTESKKEVVARARGSRLTAGLPINDADREFARGLGMSNAEIQSGWAEFIDYWISIPGRRGTKLDWSATWRNRARELASRKGRSYGRPDESKSLIGAIDRFIDDGGGAEVARAYVPGSQGPKPLALDFGPSAPSVRLLPKR